MPDRRRSDATHPDAADASLGLIHHAAGTGYARRADAYGRGRPTYHPSIVARAATLANRGPVVELGAGTGIFTAQLAGHGLAVTAVEPVAAMRAELVQAVPTATALDGTAERLPVDDGSATTVIASQSFHWFDYEPALDEIARALAPGGHLVTVWNVRDNGVDWVAACTAVTNRYAEDTPRHGTMRWRRAIDADDRFELVEDLSVPNPYPTTAQGVIDRVLSTSFIAALDEATTARVITEVDAIVAPLGERFDYPYLGELQAWRRTTRGQTPETSNPVGSNPVGSDPRDLNLK